VFGPGKVLVFADVLARDGSPYPSDMRGRLKQYTQQMFTKESTLCYVAPEIEGFLFNGRDAERAYHDKGKFDYVSTGGYYHSLPGDKLRAFIDTAAEVQRAMGFGNEKDHPEVAPSQFEMNFSYSEALITADHVQLYKLLCRQVAANMDMTASFLPKPVTGVNGNGMHTNLSFSRGGKNLLWDAKGQDGLSKAGWDAIDRILTNADDICLLLNTSVNAYRRLDPHFEAPIKSRRRPTTAARWCESPRATSAPPASKCAAWRPTATPISPSTASSAPPSTRTAARPTPTSRSGPALAPPRQHLRRHPPLQGLQVGLRDVG